MNFKEKLLAELCAHVKEYGIAKPFKGYPILYYSVYCSYRNIVFNEEECALIDQSLVEFREALYEKLAEEYLK